MIELHQFGSHWGLPNPSPFCMKVETYMRMVGIEYEIKKVENPAKGPYGKAPWIVDDGQTIADSRFIIEYLNRKHAYPLKQDLSKKQLACHHALGRTLDESTYWVLVYERWMIPENAEITRDALLAFIPNPLRKLVFAIGQRSVKKALHGQGTGRLSRQDIVNLGIRDFDTLDDLLGENPYFGGDTPAEIDATTFSYISSFLLAPVTSKVTDYARSNDKLVAYNKRMMKEIFPEYA